MSKISKVKIFFHGRVYRVCTVLPINVNDFKSWVATYLAHGNDVKHSSAYYNMTLLDEEGDCVEITPSTLHELVEIPRECSKSLKIIVECVNVCQQCILKPKFDRTEKVEHKIPADTTPVPPLTTDFNPIPEVMANYFSDLHKATLAAENKSAESLEVPTPKVPELQKASDQSKMVDKLVSLVQEVQLGQLSQGLGALMAAATTAGDTGIAQLLQSFATGFANSATHNQSVPLFVPEPFDSKLNPIGAAIWELRENPIVLKELKRLTVVFKMFLSEAGLVYQCGLPLPIQKLEVSLENTIFILFVEAPFLCSKISAVWIRQQEFTQSFLTIPVSMVPMLQEVATALESKKEIIGELLQTNNYEAVYQVLHSFGESAERKKNILCALTDFCAKFIKIPFFLQASFKMFITGLCA